MRQLPNNKMRFEIPGNFFRYVMANTVLPATFDKLSESLLNQDPTHNSSCNPRDLRCEVDPLTISLNSIDLSSESGGTKFEVVPEIEGECIRIRSIKVETSAIKIEWEDPLRLCTERPLIFNFKDDHHYQYTSTNQDHAKQRYLDRFKLYMAVPAGLCSAFLNFEIAGKNANGKYIPWTQPYYAECSDPDSENYNINKSYLIIDPLDRAENNPLLESLRERMGNGMDVYCSDPLLVDIDGQHAKLSDTLRLTYNLSEAAARQVLGNVRTYGCMGEKISYMTMDGKGIEDIGSLFTDLRVFPFSKRPSIAPFTLDGELKLPKMSATIQNMIMKVRFPIFQKVAEKYKKRV